MRGITQRSHHVGHVIALVEVAEFDTGETHLLNHQCDGASLNVGGSDGQRHTFALLSHAHNHEVAGFATLGNEGSLNLKEEHLLREL